MRPRGARPRTAQVRERREQPAVADAAQRHVELVRPQAVRIQVAASPSSAAVSPIAGTPCPPWRPVRSPGRGRAGGTARRPRVPRGSRARRSRRCCTRTARRRGTPWGDRRGRGGSPRRRGIDGRLGQDVVVHVELGFIEVVADAGPVAEQVPDRDVVGDERQVAAEERARRGVERQRPVDDEAHHGERGSDSLAPLAIARIESGPTGTCHRRSARPMARSMGGSGAGRCR